MKVIITGGAGFIGSHLADRLLDAGHSVAIIDNLETGRSDNAPPRPNFVSVHGSVADANAVEALFNDFAPDRVVHAAASYKDPDAWTNDVLTNALGTVNVVRAAQTAGVSRFVYFQTSLCYGLRPSAQPVPLDHPLQPENSYSISKTAGEAYIRSSGLDYLSFRLANVYGPRNISGPLPTFFRRISSKQPCVVVDTRRDFIYVNDLIDLVTRAVGGEGRPGVYHVASGRDWSIGELFEETLRAMGLEGQVEAKQLPRGPDDTESILLDPSATSDEFDWHPTTALHDGVRAAVEWYQNHEVGETYTHLKLPQSER